MSPWPSCCHWDSRWTSRKDFKLPSEALIQWGTSSGGLGRTFTGADVLNSSFLGLISLMALASFFSRSNCSRFSFSYSFLLSRSISLVAALCLSYSSRLTLPTISIAGFAFSSRSFSCLSLPFRRAWPSEVTSMLWPYFSRKRPRRVLSKKALSLNIVIKHCLKFCWSDGCLERLSSKTAQSSAEVMAVFKDCHQRLPKVLLKWWLSSKTREKMQISD